MHKANEIKNLNNEFDRICLALKALRLKRGLSRQEAALKAGWKFVSVEQMENGRCNFSKRRMQHLLSAYACSEAEFTQILKDPKRYVSEACLSRKKDPSVVRRPRRNHFKIVTKEVRALRILRKRKGLSQYEAARVCGFVPGGFGHIEVGRIDLKRERIDHILKCLGYVWDDFDQLIQAPVMRDELIEEAIKSLHQLDDLSLTSAANIIKALIK